MNDFRGKMDPFELRDIAAALHTAKNDNKPMAPPSRTWPPLDTDSAFEVQRITTRNAVKNGDRLVRYKLGNIAKAMQAAFGVDEPDYGFLVSSSLIYEGTPLKRSKYIRPYVELEPAVVLKAPLRGPGVTVIDVINAIDYILPAIEIIDSRVTNWEINHSDTLADNGSCGSVILGAVPRKLTELALNDCRGSLKFNGVERMSGNTNAILGNPVNGIAWLANRLAAYGLEFEAGQLILPGSCLEAIPMEEQGHWSGIFEGFGSVEFDVE
ncbi:hypothetical protein MBLNU230_g1544t1 [Neophaeotheca triangularis]